MSLEAETSGPSIRDHVEAAVASHGPSSDIDSIVSGAREEHSREISKRNEPAPGDKERVWEGPRSEKLRDTIRKSVTEEKLRVAKGGPATPVKAAEPATAAVGPPATWDKTAQAAWHDKVPPEVRQAILRDQAAYKTAIEGGGSHQQYQELDRVLAPARQRYQQHGMNDAQAVNHVLQWEAAISNPATSRQALLMIMQHNKITFQDLIAAARGQGGQQQPQQQHQQMAQHQGGDQQQMAAAVHQQLSSFAKARPHFERVRRNMGALIHANEKYTRPDGSTDLDAAYHDACKIEGLTPNGSPTSHAPMRQDTGKRGSSVRDALTQAFRENRKAG